MIGKIAEIFIQPFPHWEKIDFFRKVLYVFLLVNAISLLPIATEIFAYDGIVGSSGWNTTYPWYMQGSRVLVNVLSHPLNSSNTWISNVFVYGQIAALIAGIFNFMPRLMSVIVYFLTVNLFLKGYLMFTGGEALVNILLFYLIFVQRSNHGKATPTFSTLQNVLNNTFYWVILIQICVLYFFSTAYKLIDEFWLNGEALMYISRVDAFSSGIMRWLFADNPTVSLIATYSVLLYQSLFPILVWFKRIKVPFLLVGVVFHLSISFGMGVFTFGILMILTYLLFLDQSQIRTIRKMFKRKTKVTVGID
mgnify:CR=1 FL=1